MLSQEGSPTPKHLFNTEQTCQDALILKEPSVNQPNCNRGVMVGDKKAPMPHGHMDQRMPAEHNGCIKDAASIGSITIPSSTAESVGSQSAANIATSGITTPTTSKMPITTISLTVAMVTTMVQPVGTVMTTSATTTSIVSTSTFASQSNQELQCESTQPEGTTKCKTTGEDGENPQAPGNKRRILLDQHSMKTESSEVNLIEKLLSEVRDVKGIVSQIQVDNLEWKKKVDKDLSDVKDSVEMAHNMINDEVKECKDGEKAMREELKEKTKEILNTIQKTRTQGDELNVVKNTVSMTQKDLKELHEKHDALKIPVMEVKSRIEAVTGSIKYPVNRTVVAQRVWCDEPEDIRKVAETIVNRVLNLPNINIVHVIRKSGRPGGNGLIKIELASEDDVPTVLKAKKLLKSSKVPQLREIFLRGSKNEDTLKMERNMDLVLHDMGVRDEYVRLWSGYLVRRDQFSTGCGGRGVGQGTVWGRPRGRQAWSSRRGPAIGRVDLSDARVTQAQFREEQRTSERDNQDHPQRSNINNSDISIHEYME